MNSLLSTSFPERANSLPQFDRFTSAEVPEAITTLLQRYDQAIVGALAATGVSASELYDQIERPLEQADDDLSCAFSTIEHLHRVCDTEALRAVYSPALEQVTEHASALMQNRSLFDVITRIANAPGFAELQRPQRTAIEHSLRDFRLGGVALEGQAAERFRAISLALSQLSTDFEEAVLDATDAWKKPITELAQLAGIPADAIARFQAAGGETATYLIDLTYPSYAAVVTYATDRALREEIYTAYSTRASDQGPNAGSFDNGPKIERMLALKLEAAQLLGFENSAIESLATKMASSPERVLQFLDDLLRQARPWALKEFAQLREFAGVELNLVDMQPWDVAFVSEKYKAATLGFDDELLRPYFPYPHVLKGLFSVLGRVFGIQVRQAQVAVWHSDVEYFELLRGNQVIASCYIDPYARAKKRSGAWMDVCRSQRRIAGKHRRPVAYLNCNFAPPNVSENGTSSALLTHDDVVTLFHEFGHGLHLMLSEVDVPAVGGIEGVEWDAVELPSQFFENFCWQPEGLDLLAQHHQTGAPLPVALKAKLLASKQFQSGLFLVRQLEFALFDFTIHLQTPAPDLAQVYTILAQVRARTSVLSPPAWQRFAQSFSHIFGGGYGAGYYSYLWAEVLSADAFAAFPEGATFDAACGERFRKEVLAVGGARPALESFVAFRGREPDVMALLKSYGLSA
jgi:oligopeptidase A